MYIRILACKLKPGDVVDHKVHGRIIFMGLESQGVSFYKMHPDNCKDMHFKYYRVVHAIDEVVTLFVL
jgi:hypothetical protein